MMWLFKRRSISHPTFGKMKPVREGKFWKSKVAFAPSGGNVSLAVAGQDGPTAAQENLYLQIRQHYPRILPHALRALYAEYQRLRAAKPEGKWPVAAEPKSMARLARLDEIWLDCHQGHRFVLSFQSTSRKDHTFNIFFKNWKLESVHTES